MQKKLGRNTVVLLGVGHTNAHVLRMWKMNPLPNAQLVCVSDFPVATYSGMMPGVLAGQYPKEAMEIDLVRLCNSAGSRLIVGKVNGLDLEKYELQFADRPPLSFELLSIGIGSRPSFNGVEVLSEEALVAVKPMQTLLARLQTKLKDSSAKSIAVVGGGIGSIEVAFCLNQRLRSTADRPKIMLVTGSRVGSGLLESTATKIRKQLSARTIDLHEGARVSKIYDDGLGMSDGNKIDADLVIWATNAVAPPLLGKLGLKTDQGFLATRPTLQTVTNDRVFAVGDTGTIEESKTAKAGVYAVRQGPVLWRNIQNHLNGRKLESYVPQKGFLKLVNTGDNKSIAEYGGRSFYGQWCWRLKNRIDVKFMKMYQDYSLMEMKPEPIDTETAMRCLGCGGKIGSELLSHVISELDLPQNENVIVGIDHPDDAAVVRTQNNEVTVTTDFFASPIEDPYLVGRIATLNSVSDCFVMGARPTSALAIVQLPLGHPRGQMQVMRELMEGSAEELNRIGASIVGGHTIEGPRTVIGFTVLANQIGEPKIKGGLNTGDRLILTKPIGSGVLLAALMQSRLHGMRYTGLIDAMLQSNEIALKLINSFSVSAITDVTGFGLAGHLAEMLVASNKSVEVEFGKIPLLYGCQDLIDAGIESTLADSNRSVAGKVALSGFDVAAKRYASLFDPQTGGGLLFGVPGPDVDKVLNFLHGEGYSLSADIGEIVDPSEGPQIFVS